MNKKDREKINMPEKRRSEIKNLFSQEKILTVSFLSNHFGVSYLTIREDLKKLEDEGLISKVHGGAVLKDELENEPVFRKQIKLFKKEKDSIALEASKRVNDGDTLIIESGSTGLSLVRYLESKKNLKISTAGVPIAIELMKLADERDDIEISLCGGLVRPGVYTFVGEHAIEFFKKINVKISFIGATAVSLDKGITTATTVDAELTRAVAGSAERVILLSDSSKFETISYINVMKLNKIDEIITDNKLDENIFKRIKSMGIKITLV